MATAGKLHVTVVEARVETDLNTFSSMSPYVMIEHRMQRFMTKADSDGGKEPKFNETFVFDVKYIGDDFNMKLMSKNTLSSDSEMGESIIKVSGLCINNGMDDWWAVMKNGKREGNIHFKSVWEPSGAQTHDKEIAEKDSEIARLQQNQQQQQMAGMQQQQMMMQQPMGY